jgi:hypothetical protein
MKVVRLSALHTGRLYLPENISNIHFCQRLNWSQDHSAAGRIMSMKNSNDTIGNWYRELPVCTAVPQLTAPPRAPTFPSSLKSLLKHTVITPLFETNICVLYAFAIFDEKLITIPYTECPRRNVPNFGRVFLMLKYSAFGKSLYTYKRCWKWCPRASIKNRSE